MKDYYLFIIILLLISLNGVTQNFADKEYYLVDSLVLGELTNDDRQLLDNSLEIYHSSENVLDKINALNGICENMMHNDWTKFQFFQHKIIEDALQQNKSGAIKLELLKSLAESINNIGVIYGDLGLTNRELKYYFKSLDIHEQLNNKNGISDIYNNIGYLYRGMGEINKAHSYYKKSLKIAIEIGDKQSIALSLNNIGNILDKQGEVKKALKYYHRSLKIEEELEDKRGIAMCYVNIGTVLGHQGNKKKSLEYFLKGLTLQQEIGNKSGIANCLHNIATYYGDLGKHDKALEYFNEALQLNRDLDNKTGMANALINIGVIYFHKRELTKALEFCLESLKLRNEFSINEGLGNNHIVMGNIYMEQNRLGEAIKHAKIALELNEKIGYPRKISEAAKLLSFIYAKQNNGMKAFEMHKLYILMRDSTNNLDNARNSAVQEANYKFQKEKELNDAAHDKMIAIKQRDQEKQRVIIYATISGLALAGLFLVFVINRLKVTRKQKDIIEEQRDEVEIQKQEIMDSITYAKRIQSAILPSDKMLNACLPDSFVLYKPKDIVAGDFYWIEPTGDKVLFAAADCTGHGVPGAMVSVVCNNALNRSVREYELTNPGKILDKTRDIVMEEFEKSDEEVKDGMDIALCSLEANTLKYSGAHNPLWIVRNDELLETKANKQPIGKFDHPEPFTTHSIQLQKGDNIYIFSDGFVDQFGGEKGKKFKGKAFRNLLLSINDKSMEEQKEILDNSFESWKKDLEQVDDVCIIGVRI